MSDKNASYNVEDLEKKEESTCTLMSQVAARLSSLDKHTRAKLVWSPLLYLILDYQQLQYKIPSTQLQRPTTNMWCIPMMHVYKSAWMELHCSLIESNPTIYQAGLSGYHGED